MSIRSLLRLAALFALLSSIAVYTAAQDVRDASVYAQDSTGTVEQQYFILFRRLVNPPAQPELCDHQTNQGACIVRLPVHTIRKCEGVAAFAALLGVIVILQVLVGAYTSGFGGHQMSRPIW